MHEIEPRHVLRLVPLKMSDEMPADRGTNRIHLVDRLLNPVLTDVPEPCLNCRLDRFGTMRFGHGDDRDLLALTPTLDGSLDAVPDLPQAIR
jgi:hypothetical protein